MQQIILGEKMECPNCNNKNVKHKGKKIYYPIDKYRTFNSKIRKTMSRWTMKGYYCKKCCWESDIKRM